LNPEEQEMLERLSVFAGGFDLQSAEAVTGAGFDSPVGVLDQLARLVDKSLLQADDVGSGRYRLLDTVRDYATAKLLARSQTAAGALRAAHRDHYLALAESAAPHLIGHGQTEWLDANRTGLVSSRGRGRLMECQPFYYYDRAVCVAR
jgi:predicted ATPase